MIIAMGSSNLHTLTLLHVPSSLILHYSHMEIEFELDLLVVFTLLIIYFIYFVYLITFTYFNLLFKGA